MALKLDSKPGNSYDSEEDNKNSWRPPGYDKDNSGYDSNNPSSKATPPTPELEANPSINDGQTSATSTKEGGLYNPSPSGRRGKKGRTSLKPGTKIRFTRRQKTVGGGVAIITITGVIAAGVITSGPLQILQFANLLQRFHLTKVDSLTEDRLGNFYRYLKHPNNPENRRVGAIANRSATKIETEFRARGLNPVWENGRLTRLDVNPADLPALRSAGLGPNIIETNGTFRIDIDPPGTSARDARAAMGNVTDVVRSLDVKVGAIGMRNLRAKAGVGFFDNSVRRLGQNLDSTLQEKSDRYRELRAESVESDEINGKVTTAEDTANENGETERVVAEDSEIQGKAGAQSKIDSIKSGATKGIAVVGIACAAYQLAEQADDLRKSNVIQPLMRNGMRVLTIASQIQFGTPAVDLEALGFLARDMFDASAPVGAQSWREGAGIQGNLGESITGPSIPESAHPNNGGNFILQAFQAVEAFGGQAISTVCGALTSAVGTVAGYALNFTPVGFAVDVATDQLVNVLFNQYGDDLVALLAGKAVDTAQFTGAVFGAAADFGVMLAGNETMLSLGGRVMTPAESGQLNRYYAELRQEEMKQKSIFERYFAISNPESLIAQSATTTASLSNAKALVGNISTGKYAKNLGKTVSNLFVDKTYAQSATGFDYDVDQIDFSVAERNDPRYQNSIENETLVLPILQQNKDKINKCFGLELQPDNSLIPIEDAIRIAGSERDSSCDETSEEWTRIRFYIADQNIASSFDCVRNSDTDSCKVVGLANTASNSSGGPTTGGTGEEIPLDGYKIGGIQVDSTAESCTGGLREGAREVAEFVKARWGKSYGGYDCRGKSTNSSSLSIHAEGRAIDQMYDAFDPVELAEANETFGWLMANAQSIGIQYVKFWKLQWSPTNGLRCVTSQSDVNVHSNHIHYEVNRDAAAMQTPWFTNPTDFTPFRINQNLCP
jgi:hypothetical protein